MLTSLGFRDVVSSSHAFGNFHTGSLASHANELAAMPSLHMAWAAWCALAKAKWKLSPCISTSTPPCVAQAWRKSRRCASSEST